MKFLISKSLNMHNLQKPQPATLIKKRPLHRCFPVNFAKFLRTPFSIEHLLWLLLNLVKSTQYSTRRWFRDLCKSVILSQSRPINKFIALVFLMILEQKYFVVLPRETFKDTHREKKPVNSSAYKKQEYGHLCCWYIKSTYSLQEVLKLKQIFQKNKAVTGKTPFFVMGPFCTHHSICLNIGF